MTAVDRLRREAILLERAANRWMTQARMAKPGQARRAALARVHQLDEKAGELRARIAALT